MTNNKRYYMHLTKREKTVIKYIADGYYNNYIAEQMGVSCHTIKAFVASILRKLDAKNRTNAVFKAVQAGILPDDEARIKINLKARV